MVRYCLSVSRHVIIHYTEEDSGSVYVSPCGQFVAMVSHTRWRGRRHHVVYSRWSTEPSDAIKSDRTGIIRDGPCGRERQDQDRPQPRPSPPRPITAARPADGLSYQRAPVPSVCAVRARFDSARGESEFGFYRAAWLLLADSKQLFGVARHSVPINNQTEIDIACTKRSSLVVHFVQ